MTESFLDRLADWLAPCGLVFLGYSEAVLAPTPRLRVQRPRSHPRPPRHPKGGTRGCGQPHPQPRRPATLPHRGTRTRTAGFDGVHGPAHRAEMAQAGEVAARDGNHAEAVAAFRKAVFLDPDHPVAWFQLASPSGRSRTGAGPGGRTRPRCRAGAVRPERVTAGLDGWAADELAGVLRARLGRP